MSENTENTEVVKASRKDFNTWFSDNPGAENADLYDQFPNNPTSTLRRWKMDYINSKSQKISPEEQSVPSATPKEETLSLNNKTLMRGTPFSEKTFQGMTPNAINKFLLNWHEGRRERGEDTPAPNTPIVGTPVGSGNPKMPIDDFLTMDAKNQKIYFEAKASKVFSKAKNKEEAYNKWVQP